MELLTLKNGMKLVLEAMPSVRSVTFGIWVKNGSRNECAENNGISHFIEHMFFKGTQTRTAKDIADEIDAVGGQINAYTSKEYTCYHTRTLDDHIDVALEVLSDMFLNSKFDENEIQKECNVIVEEINMYEDTPDELVHDLLQYNVWHGSSLGYPILGTENSISQFKKNIFEGYYYNNYRPSNTVIAVAGSFCREEILEKAEKYFGSFTEPKIAQISGNATMYKPCLITREKDIEQVHLLFGFPSISIGSDDAYVLAVLNTVFGGGMSSRIFQKIREEHGLAYSVYSYNSSYIDAGLFGIYAGLNINQLQQLISKVIHEIKDFKEDSMSAIQLERTKEQIKSNYVMGLESSANMMSTIGKSQLMLNRVLAPAEIIERINKVSLDDVNRLAAEIFDFNQMSLSAVGNLKGANLQEMLDNAR